MHTILAMLTRSETDVAMSSMMISNSVVPGSMMDAKYSVMFGEQHLASTDTSCRTIANVKHRWFTGTLHIRNDHAALDETCMTCLVNVFNVVLTAPHNNGESTCRDIIMQKQYIQTCTYTSSRSITFMATSR